MRRQERRTQLRETGANIVQICSLKDQLYRHVASLRGGSVISMSRAIAEGMAWMAKRGPFGIEYDIALTGLLRDRGEPEPLSVERRCHAAYIFREDHGELKFSSHLPWREPV